MGGALLWAGCANSSGAHKSGADPLADGALAENATPGASAGARDAQESLPSFRPDPASARVTAMGWGRGGELRLGYADGKWGKIEATGGDASLEFASKKGPVISLSAKGELAFIGSTPPVIVRLRDHQVVLNLHKINQMSAGGFFVSGAGFFAAEKSGALHVWKRSEEQLDQASTRDLKRVAMRQAADFSVGLPPSRGQWLVTPQDSLVMGATDGELLSWRLSTPDALDTVGRLPGAVRSLGLADDYFVATTTDGALYVSERARPVFLPWSEGARAEVVAASSKLDSSFALVEKSGDQLVVGMRDFESGEYGWRASLEAGELCGFELSPDARRLALCADSGVLILDASSGALLGALRRSGESMQRD